MTAGRRFLVGLCCVFILGLMPGLAHPIPRAWAQPGCSEQVADGGFETGGAWQLGATPAPPQYVSDVRHSGSRSLRLGIIGGANQESFSSARQTVTIPASTAQATLSFWFYSVVTGAPADDYMQLLLFESGSPAAVQVWRTESGTGAWNQVTIDLTSRSGSTFDLYFNVFNNGAGATTGMYLDDVSLTACSGTPTTGTTTPTASVTPVVITATNTPIVVTSTPIVVTATSTPIVVTSTPIVVTATSTPIVVTATPEVVTATNTPVVVTATPGGATPVPGTTPMPPDCTNLLVNGDFEAGLTGWWPGPNRLPVRVVNTQVRSGAWALQLGTLEANLNSYSSIRQPVKIPANVREVTLTFWTYTWAESISGTDHQEAVLLAPDNSIIEKVWRTLANDGSWVPHTIPLTRFAGRSLTVYFNVVNDGAGGRTGMYLDDVRLWVCPAPAAPPDGHKLPVKPGAWSQVYPGQAAGAGPAIPAEPVVIVVTATPGPGEVEAAAAGPAVAAITATGTAAPSSTPESTAIILSTPEATLEPTSTPPPSALVNLWNAVREAVPAPALLLGLIVFVLVLLGLIYLVSSPR